MNFNREPLRTYILYRPTHVLSTFIGKGTKKTTQQPDYPVQWQDPLIVPLAATKAEAAVQV